MAKKFRAGQATSHLQGLTLFASRPPKQRGRSVQWEQPNPEPKAPEQQADVKQDENFLVMDELVTNAAITTKTVSTSSSSSSSSGSTYGRSSDSHSNHCQAFRLGDHIEVYAGGDLIDEGSYIESSDKLLVWVDTSGNVRFTFLGGRISVVKV